MKKAIIFVLLVLLMPLAMAATVTIRPNGVGYRQGWTNVGCGSGSSEWQCVDETPTATSDYLRATETAKETFTFSDTGLTSGQINSVTLYYYSRWDLRIGNSCFGALVRLGGMDYLAGKQMCANSAWNYYSHTYTTNPATGSAWTIAQVDALEAGMYGLNPNGGGQVAQVYAVVDYIQIQPDSCTDTDGGNAPLVFGTVSGYLNGNAYNHSDSCTDADNVNEYYCSGNHEQTAVQNCGIDTIDNPYCSGDSVYQDATDYFCSGGACRSSTTQMLQQDCNDYDGYGASYCIMDSVYKDFTDSYCSSGNCSANITSVFQRDCNALDTYTENYCYHDSIYRDFKDYYCGNGLCGFTLTRELVEECDFACNYTSPIAQCLDIPLPLSPKVMVIIYNPILESQGNLSLVQYTGWNDPNVLTASYIQNIRDASSGYVRYQVEETHEVDDIPVKEDGFQYTDETYLECLNNHETCHPADMSDYNQILNDFDVCTKLNNGEIDELWLFGAPWFGYYESRLAGPDAFWYNSPPLEGTSCNRLLPIMGFSYERGNAEMLEDFGHRTEASMTEVFRGWDITQSRHDWDRYGHNLGQTPGVDFYQCGSVHYPPNGISDYDYANLQYVESNCDDWLNYPYFTGATKTINCEEWGCAHESFLIYWLSHLPRSRDSGFKDGKLKNWWDYIVGNRYDEVYPKITGVSSEYAPDWSKNIFDGTHGVCNEWEWATAGQPTGWIQIEIKDDINTLTIYDRACPEQVLNGRVELNTGEIFPFGELEDTGSIPTSVQINRANVDWIKIYIDNTTGDNPGIGEIVIG